MGPYAHRRIAEPVGQVQHEEDQRAQNSHRQAERGDSAGGKSPQAEQRQVDHRGGGDRLYRDESDEQKARTGQTSQDAALAQLPSAVVVRTSPVTRMATAAVKRAKPRQSALIVRV